MSLVAKHSQISTTVSEPIASRPLKRHRAILLSGFNTSIPRSRGHTGHTVSLIRNASRQSAIVFHGPDGRVIDIPSAIATGVLTRGEKITLAITRAIRASSKRWITHVSLVILLLTYTLIGGAIFHYVEGTHEVLIKKDLDGARVNLSRKIWLSFQVHDEAAWHENFANDIKVYEQKIVAAPAAISGANKWDFVGSMFFSGTVYTTIGYGNVVPTTDIGRCLTMLYAFVGIPLVLIVLADFGKILTRIIKHVWSFVRRLHYIGRCLRFRSLEAVQAVNRSVPRKRETSDLDSAESTPEYVAFTVDDNFDLPVSVAIFLLLGYIVVGALIMKEWERDWSYLHAIYFVFVSLTTIGFGDIVPKNNTYLLITFFYLLFGLALTSMCINVVQVSISNTTLKAKEKIAAHIGLSSDSSRRTRSYARAVNQKKK